MESRLDRPSCCCPKLVAAGMYLYVVKYGAQYLVLLPAGVGKRARIEAE